MDESIRAEMILDFIDAINKPTDKIKVSAETRSALLSITAIMLYTFSKTEEEATHGYHREEDVAKDYASYCRDLKHELDGFMAMGAIGFIESKLRPSN